MTQYNTLNVKLSKSQLNKLKSGTNNGRQLWLNYISDYETNFLHKMLLTNT